jgi:hypothetical protein
LSSYYRFTGACGCCSCAVYYWNNATRSYYSGTETGDFQAGEFYENFAANTLTNVAGGYAQQSTILTLH